MKFAVLFAASSAMLATAGPLRKRVLTTEVVVEMVTVTVTAGDEVKTHVRASPTYTAEIISAGPYKPPYNQFPPVPPVDQPVPTVSESTPTAVPPPPTVVEPPPSPTVVEPSPEPTPTTTDVPPPGNGGSGNPFQKAALSAHNIHRANHSAPDLTWDDTIAGYAAQVAKSCVFAHNRDIGGGNYGQNLAMTGSSGDNADADTNQLVTEAASAMWYTGEFNAFLPLFGQEDPDMTRFKDWGHLTQAMWKGTDKLGCAIQFCPKGSMSPDYNTWFTVCNYFPPGNVKGEYAENVGVPLGMPSA